MINALIDTSPLANLNANRGIGTYTRYLIKALNKLNNIEVIRSSHPKSKQYRPDLVHFPYFDFFFPTLKLHNNIPNIVTIHDCIPLVFPKHFKPGIKGKINLIRQKKSLNNTDLIITDSENSKKDIIKHLNQEENKIKVISLAPNPKLETQSQSTIDVVRKKYDIAKTYILYVGDINYNKNIPQLIKTLKYLPHHVHLVLLGRSFHKQDIPQWRWIEAQIAASQVEKRVIMINNLLSDQNQDLAAIYTGALCYVQPSIYEGFGLPILEAMRCKTPVICAKNSSLSEVAGEFALLANKAKAQNFSKLVQIVMDMDHVRRNNFVQAASNWSKEFTWKKTAQETYQAYQNSLQK